MGECSTQQLMEEISKSWLRNKLTLEIYLYIFKKRGVGEQLRSITFFFFLLFTPIGCQL